MGNWFSIVASTHLQKDGGTLPAETLDPIAIIALLLSIIGLMVTIFLRYLDGPRVRIAIKPVLLNIGYGRTLTHNGGQWPIPEATGGAKRKFPRFGEVVELAEIVIENVGRHPTTISEVGFKWLGERDHWWQKRLRHSIVPVPIRPPWVTDPRTYVSGDRFRIEPNDVVTVLVDYWGFVRSDQPSSKGLIELRGAVRVAGRRRMKQSPRKRRWRIKDTAVTSIGTAQKIPVRAVITGTIALSSLYSEEKELGDIWFFSRALESALEGQWTGEWDVDHEKLQQFKEESSMNFAFLDNDDFSQISLLIDVHDAIDARKAFIDWEDIEQPHLHAHFSGRSREPKTSAADQLGEQIPPTGADGGLGPASH